MNKTFLFALVGVIIVVLGLLFVVFGKQSSQGSKNTADADILLYVDQGDVSYKTPDGAFLKASSSPVAITSGTLVYTGLGRATVLFPNNSSVVLDEYTELAIVYEEKRVSLYQTLGTTYHRVEALLSGSTYEVETPGTLAAVRGTKFAVKYDKKTKATKVAVTEHRVEVSKFNPEEAGTTTKNILERIQVEEGKTVRVDLNRNTATSGTSTGSFTMADIKEDSEMNAWVEENRKRDEAEALIKETNADTETLREELKELIETERVEKTTETETTITSPNTQTETKTDTRSTTEQKQPVVEQKTTTDVQATAERVPTQTALSEEAFFDKFNDMFINYFYLDDRDTPCTIALTATERVRNVTTFASESGYPFLSGTLPSFAENIATYCKSKNPDLKVKLRSQFDTEFPYQENI